MHLHFYCHKRSRLYAWIDCWVSPKTNLGHRETFFPCWELCQGCSATGCWHHYFTVLRYGNTVGSDIDNMCSSLNLMTRLLAGWSRSQSLILASCNRYFSSSQHPDQLMTPFGLLHSWYWVLFPSIKAAWHGANHSVHIVLRIRMSGFVSTSSYVFMWWCC